MKRSYRPKFEIRNLESEIWNPPILWDALIEKEAENGQSLLWYEYDSKGEKYRKERRPNVGIVMERIE